MYLVKKQDLLVIFDRNYDYVNVDSIEFNRKYIGIVKFTGFSKNAMGWSGMSGCLKKKYRGLDIAELKIRMDMDGVKQEFFSFGPEKATCTWSN